MNTPMLLIAVTLVLTSGAAFAQSSHTIYDASGRVQSRTSTDSQGNVTIYDAQGRVSERMTTSGRTITIYGADGRKSGTITKDKVK